MIYFVSLWQIVIIGYLYFRNSANQIDIEILENEDLIVPEGVSPSEYHRIYRSPINSKES